MKINYTYLLLTIQRGRYQLKTVSDVLDTIRRCGIQYFCFQKPNEMFAKKKKIRKTEQSGAVVPARRTGKIAELKTADRLAQLVEPRTTPCGTTSFPRSLCNEVAVRESARDQNFDGINTYSGSLNN